VEGKTVVVTGGNAGIGLETARALAALGARVVLAVRDEAKGRAAAHDIKGRVEVAKLDLADLDDVRRFAREAPPVDVLVNNAGLHTARFARTRQGFEETFGVNHLAHFLLTRELIARHPPARVVTVASQAHVGARVDWDDLQGERRWSGLRAYANSKLLNLWFARELARRRPDIVSVAVHPGSVRTGWARGRESGVFRIGVALASPFLLSPAQGARTSVFCATSPDVRSGGYYVRQRLAEPSALARDDAQAAKLWNVSERLISQT
jgi:NAD(P)-dependent dehydrogenase (short-subunit alcohol dehydrogenase family)